MPRPLRYQNLLTKAYAKCGEIDNKPALDSAAAAMLVSRATAARWRKLGKIETLLAAKYLSEKIGWPISWFTAGIDNVLLPS